MLKNSIKEFKAYLGDRESLLDTNYQKIAEMIKLHWGYKEIYLYINKLLVVDKDRNRQGFPLEVLQEIYTLQEIHEKLFPETKMLSTGQLQGVSEGRKNKNSTFF
ncbi:MAG: hypothetical protein KA524_08865 [Nitrosomonas sp.]|nr:hypothetical protein [Nitrosomonas sp.]MBP6076415.1 hypothetical protein [Nitrosomonas sp.]